MSFMRPIGRFAAAAAVLVGCLWPVPAQAVADAGIAVACGDPFRCVEAVCVAHVAAPAVGDESDAAEATVLISGSAHAQGAFVPASTQVTCVVSQGGQSRGGCTMRLPGGTATCVGTAQLDLDRQFEVCAQGSVLWVPDGETVAGDCSG